MNVLYKNEDDVLAIMEVTKAFYLPEEKILQFCGPEDDFGIKASLKEANKIVKALYENGKADVTDFTYCEIDFYDEDEDDEDEEDDFMNDILNSVDGIHFK